MRDSLIYGRLRFTWPWLPLWTAAALVAIFSHGPMPLYSTRTLAVAWDMWAHGHWIVPHLNGSPYSEKAPLLFWLINAGWLVFGVNDIWPRILEVAFGATQLVLAALLAMRLFPDRPRIARTTPWLLLGLGYAFLFSLQVMYDVLLAVWVLAALLCLTPKAKRVEPHWVLFGLCIGLGLLTKGPVMLLHVLFPWLLGPLWNDWARQHKSRWYLRGVFAVLLAAAILLAWALPAGYAGGEPYRHRLLFTQTAGRAVHAFEHAAPFWWYLPVIPALLFPASAWPRAWLAMTKMQRPWPSGIRFALCWLIPAMLAFSLVSGKQPYYPLPEYAGAMLLCAGAVSLFEDQRPDLANSYWLGTWLLGALAGTLGIFLLILPILIGHGLLRGEWLDSASQHSGIFGGAFLLLTLLLMAKHSDGNDAQRIGFSGLIGAVALNALFTMSMWQNFDMRPTARLLGSAEHDGKSVGYEGNYAGQFDFAGRLTQPIEMLTDDHSVQAFARTHPDGFIVTRPETLTTADLQDALLIQPFRSSWVVVWSAKVLARVRAGEPSPAPSHPATLYQLDRWRSSHLFANERDVTL